MNRPADPEKRAVIAKLILTGSTVAEIARVVGYSETYIAKIKRKMRQETPAQFDYQVAKQTMRERSYEAINSGLRAESDMTTKDRALLGVQVLKGTGDLVPDHLSIVAQQWSNTPPGLAELVRSLPARTPIEPSIDVEVQAPGLPQVVENKGE